MELYIGQDEIAKRAKVQDLENALAAVKALNGKKDLCLQTKEGGKQLILTILPPEPTIPECYGMELVFPSGAADCKYFDDWNEAANAMRRFLAGRRPYPPMEIDDDCPCCQMLKVELEKAEREE